MNILSVGVVIVSYKTAKLSIDALASVAAERLQNPKLSIHAVVVDNASGDYDEIHQAILKNQWSSWATALLSPVNGGFGYGNNLGFNHLQSKISLDYLYLLNPDARCENNAIVNLVKALESDLTAGIAGSCFSNQDGSDWPIAFRFPTILGECNSGLRIGVISKLLHQYVIAKEMSKALQPIDWIAGASMMIKRHVFEALRGFDESYFLYYEETDLCFRASKNGYKTLYVPESRVMHIAGQSTKVTERISNRKRFPNYWYESRMLFYYKNYGLAYSMFTDLVAIFSTLIGNVWLYLTKKNNESPLNFYKDVLANSAILLKNRVKKAFISQL